MEFLLISLALAGGYVLSSLRVLKQYERGVVFFLGKYTNTKGPGLLCRAMGIDRTHNGHDLVSDDLFLAAPERPESFAVVAGPRIGVGYAGEWAERPLRFSIAGNRYVSRR